MPSSRSIASTVQRPSPVSQQDFNFPPYTHLLITTPSRILSWDSQGLHTIFTSSKSGIAAATESKHGAGILAVADKHTVVLQDTKRGQERSWGLSNADDEVRHLEYTADSKSLFLSTKVTNVVQCYSTQKQRLLSPPQTLSSPPVALAVAPSAHLMISVEGSPPVVYLKDLVQNTAATLFQAQTSPAAVAVAAFHPERANIFLLGFEDGTLAVFDASRLSKIEAKGPYAKQEQAGRGEIGRLTELHRLTAAKEGRRRRAITGAAFLPGHKSRVVTVGTDSRCKLVDFAEGGNVLRTWHCKAPLASVSVYALPDPYPLPTSIPSKGKQRVIEPATEGQHGSLIAVGSEDGRVLLYDALGLLQARKKISESGERIISVEWIVGPSPEPVKPTLYVAQAADLPARTSPKQRSRRKGMPKMRKSSTPKQLSLHPALHPPKLDPTIPQVSSPRRFTVHPDEIVEEGTVRRIHSPERKPLVSPRAGAYLDLFSPVNPSIAHQSRDQPKQMPTPSRRRPQISSQTFSRDDTPQRDDHSKAAIADSLHLPVPDSALLDSLACRPSRPSPTKNVLYKPRRASSRISPLKTKHPRASMSSQRAMTADVSRSSDITEHLDATGAANARLLRDSRQMNAKSAGAHAGSILQSYAGKSKQAEQPSSQAQPQNGQQAPRQVALQPQQQVSVPQPPRQPVQTHVFGPGGRWPTDSVDESSWDDAFDQEDIWITSDEEHHYRSSARRHHLFHRPPARQTSRSRVDSRGTVGTGRGLHVDETSTVPLQSSGPHGGTFAPQSEDVRSLFPRKSSLSPRKKHRSPKKRSPRMQESPRPPLAETTVNARSPRDRSSTSKRKSARNHVVNGDPKATNNLVADRESGIAFGGCVETARRVRSLEGEVVHMKGEILALRAALRKHGIPAPSMPRR